jgi:pyridoxine/pyridoxamine 5'-phosphate oxidase
MRPLLVSFDAIDDIEQKPSDCIIDYWHRLRRQVLIQRSSRKVARADTRQVRDKV